MKRVDSRTGIESLSREECLHLLATDEVGRLAIVVGSAPSIFPVNYRLDDEAIVFRSDPGTKLDHGPRARACFEIDQFDRERRSGWSVIAAGRLEEISTYDTEALDRARGLLVDPWPGGQRSHWMRLVPDAITGRRVGRR
ncbi:MAG: pyridoxamine 5'-phosphate oxidase family protein [Acidimicrobiales bacterium]